MRELAPPRLDPNIRHHPVVIREFNKRESEAQLRIADRITAFAGTMHFVYIHALLVAVWMLVFEKNPWPTLTLALSLAPHQPRLTGSRRRAPTGAEASGGYRVLTMVGQG